ncbi:hypothetical protein TNCT_426211 [Trichonephila clavata]|uniref:Uncharacterized protein n=1 Tax=Trichonephila clavata TaxID=2740835 RepID=A0A8X6LLU5_TRICU|nr:hypothetical protein TNCT_426211 [Trichonephila clavata]
MAMFPGLNDVSENSGRHYGIEVENNPRGLRIERTGRDRLITTPIAEGGLEIDLLRKYYGMTQMGNSFV